MGWGRRGTAARGCSKRGAVEAHSQLSRVAAVGGAAVVGRLVGGGGNGPCAVRWWPWRTTNKNGGVELAAWEADDGDSHGRAAWRDGHGKR